MTEIAGTDFAGIVPALAEALKGHGFETLTSVQTAMLAPEADNADLLVSAQTGSGKTVAFGIAIAPTLLAGAERLGRAGRPLALVVAPTRELALQVRRELDWLYAGAGARTVSCVGGMDMQQERRSLNSGAHIVVGTPGRLRDHIERSSLDLSELRAVVLDEADEMLDLGFRDDLEFILEATPAERRTLLFSATVPRSIATLAKRYSRNAVRIATARESEQHVDIEYRAITVAPNDRENAIINILRFHAAHSAIVFCGTRAVVTHLSSRLANRGFAVVSLSGELSQNERTHALQAMRDGRAQICVATDVAARGIDLPLLDLVVHADLPTNSDTLLHRSGRTGRAGRKGVSAVIVPYTKRRSAERLLRVAGVEATWAAPPSAADIRGRDRERMLDDPVFQEKAAADETAFASELLKRYSAEQVAVAYLRLQQTGRPAPEELLDSGPVSARPKKSRTEFAGGFWFALSAGRRQNADPRWLLPLICRVGHITKNDVGAIKIFETETRFEISAAAAERYAEALLRNGTGEKSITIVRLEPGTPEPAEPKGRPAGPEGYRKPAGKRDWQKSGKPKPYARKAAGAEKPRD